jgi:hypothetical protein
MVVIQCPECKSINITTQHCRYDMKCLDCNYEDHFDNFIYMEIDKEGNKINVF